MMTYKKIMLLGLACVTHTLMAAERPNVVIIYGDDVGYGDVGVYGSKLIPTPNIDRLAAEGLRFTDGHSSAATCSPSRYSMLTGEHAFRKGVSILGPTAGMIVPTDVLTLPKMFRQAGYATGVIGKWHLGLGDGVTPIDWNGAVKPGPLEIGFDSSFLVPITNDRVPSVYLKNHRVQNLDPADPLYVSGKIKDIRAYTGSTQYPDAKTNPEAITNMKASNHQHTHTIINGIPRLRYMCGGKSALFRDEDMADDFLEQTVEFIETHKDRPFFLFFAAVDVHVPRAPHERFVGKTALGPRGDAMVQFDWTTGAIIELLEKHGLTENTIVIFSSDNGPVYDDGYLDGTVVKQSDEEVDQGHDASGVWRAGKYQIYEGGTRVPLIIKWPGRIEPGVSDALVNQVDFMASFADLLDIELPDGEARDSRNILKTFLGKDSAGLPYMIEEAQHTTLALRSGDWKFVRPSEHPRGRIKERELYNVRLDPSEQNNLVAAYPEKADAMAEQLEMLIESNGLRTKK
ncbi:sulfatase family protein [Pontiella agarivorans]|uniref:Arylsulfatase n=1 Tax=Pontiella agarivorans TaxID=3038953 RepID=A0ABU5MSH8_9BACT|nr:arylsulfatase [Pontiella agarivorans]MDZ8117046.1 arylsulfatase [Pontiella agarivorans]